MPEGRLAAEGLAAAGRPTLPLQPVNRLHLDALSGGRTIRQHAIGSLADPAHGSCTDDVARSLQVDLLHGLALGWPAVAGSVRRNVAFLEDAFDTEAGRFRNFRATDGSWADAPGSEDCQGRALHALGDLIEAAPEAALVETAIGIFEAALPATLELGALRAMASVTLGCAAAIRGGQAGLVVTTHRILVDRFVAAFDVDLRDTWPWPEPILTYENGLPVRALIAAGRHLDEASLVTTGLRTLSWLVAAQTAPDGALSFVGNGWWPKDGARSRFDQQPIEATSLLAAAEEAFGATADERWLDVIERAYGWFLGENDLRVSLAIPDRGACHDGLTPTGVNANQGAESTLMWLTAVEHIRAIRTRAARTTLAPAIAPAALLPPTPKPSRLAAFVAAWR